MPLIQINMWEGRDKEKKRGLIKSVTDTVAGELDIPSERVQIIINEVSKDNWGIKGEQASQIG